MQSASFHSYLINQQFEPHLTILPPPEPDSCKCSRLLVGCFSHTADVRRRCNIQAVHVDYPCLFYCISLCATAKCHRPCVSRSFENSDVEQHMGCLFYAANQNLGNICLDSLGRCCVEFSTTCEFCPSSGKAFASKMIRAEHMHIGRITCATHTPPTHSAQRL